MAEQTLTLIDDGHVSAVRAAIDGDHIRLNPEALRAALGWELKPQGLCRGAVCIPTRSQPDLFTGDGVDLARVAALLARPLASDMQERVAYLGVSAADRSAQLASLEAPDFTLPDLNGRPHSLSAHRGKKVLLVAYASW